MGSEKKKENNVAGLKYNVLWKLLLGNLSQSTNLALAKDERKNLGKNFYEIVEFLYRKYKLH